MNPADLPVKITKDFSSAQQFRPSVSELFSGDNVKYGIDFGGGNEQFFEELVDMNKAADSQEEQLTTFSPLGFKFDADDKSLSTSMYLPTPPSPAPESNGDHFPMVHCCCGHSSSRENYQYENRSSLSTTIDPLHLSHKGTMEPSHTSFQSGPLPFCGINNNPLPLALIQPLTSVLHQKSGDGRFKKSIQKCKLPLKRSNQEKKTVTQPTSPVPPRTVTHGLTLAGHRRSHRTKTSYDPTTSYLLNTLFFESFGNDRKPTKAERCRIQSKAGISSRQLTYWLSNHKRRFRPELIAYQRLQRRGKIDGYDAFMEYCKRHHVPEISLYGMEPSGDTDNNGSSLSSDGEDAGDADVGADND